MRPSRRALAALTLVALVAAGLAATAGWWLLERPWAGWSGDAVEVVLEPGMSAGAMLDRLGDRGVLHHPPLVRAWVSLRGEAGKLRAGEYRFERPASALEVLRRLRAGDVLLHSITLPEGLTLFEVADRLTGAGFGPTERLVEAFRATAALGELEPRAESLEGYLFPDTYRFPRGERPEAIAAAMVRRFREVVGREYAADAVAVGLDLHEAVTLASLIEKETSVPGERGRISSVFHNRLARGMKLDCDPTVIYALRREGRQVDRLTYEDLRFASPWNTYVTKGLPPGPIANPGRESLVAAVHPAEGEDLFFVAAPGGGHRFSRSLQEHLQAVADWRRYSRSSR